LREQVKGDLAKSFTAKTLCQKIVQVQATWIEGISSDATYNNEQLNVVPTDIAQCF